MPKKMPTRREVVLDRLQALQGAGVEQLPRLRKAEAGPVEVSPPQEAAPLAPLPLQESMSSSPNLPSEESPVMPARAPKSPPQNSTDDAGEVVSQAASLEVLQQEVAGCTLCEELASTRTQTVFGVGNPKARLCFLGEAPGADEDRQGEPFVGRAGKLLNKIIEACTLTREEVYILNVLKCRPPGNRNPTPQESANCKRYLKRQLELIQPEFICCLGAVAAQNLLQTTESIGRLRGKVHSYRGIKVVCTYHPAYLLRNPAAKKDTWEDMKCLMAELGVEL